MDKAIFQFSMFKYQEREIIDLSRDTCEHLASIDEENVTKFTIENGELQLLLNNNSLDLDNSFFRVFM